MEDDKRITGKELAGELPSAEDYIAAVLELFQRVSPTEYNLSDFDSFEKALLGTYIRKFHLMCSKQKKYGKLSITDEDSLIGRWNDKLQRAKSMIGSPKQQIKALKELREQLPDDPTPQEMDRYIMMEQAILYPNDDPTGNESLEDTALDGGNYGDIFYMFLMGAWGKDMET